MELGLREQYEFKDGTSRVCRIMKPCSASQLASFEKKGFLSIEKLASHDDPRFASQDRRETESP